MGSNASLQPDAKKQVDNDRRKKLLLASGITVFGCAFLFLIADALERRLTQYLMLWETIKVFALALMPAVIVALYDHYHTIKEVSTLVAKEVEASTVRRIEDVIHGREHYGLVAFHQSIQFASLFKELESGDELLWHDTYCPRYKDFLEEMSLAIRRGVKIRMLIIDTECENAKFRAEEIGGMYSTPTFTEDVKIFTKQIVKCIENTLQDSSIQGSCEIRVYRDLPSIPMYIIIRRGRLYRGYSSFFLTEPTAYFVHLEWAPTERGLLKYMHKYFEQKWAVQLPPRGNTIFPPLTSDADVGGVNNR